MKDEVHCKFVANECKYPPAKPGALVVSRSKRPGRGRDAAT